MSNSQAIEAMTEEMAKIVGELHAAATAPDTSEAPPTVLASVSAITPTNNHLAKAHALGIDPIAHLRVIETHIKEAVEALKQFAAHVPADDPNIANVSALIERLI